KSKMNLIKCRKNFFYVAELHCVPYEFVNFRPKIHLIFICVQYRTAIWRASPGPSIVPSRVVSFQSLRGRVLPESQRLVSFQSLRDSCPSRVSETLLGA